MSAILNTSQTPAEHARPEDQVGVLGVAEQEVGDRAPEDDDERGAEHPEHGRPDEPGAERARRRGRDDALLVLVVVLVVAAAERRLIVPGLTSSESSWVTSPARNSSRREAAHLGRAEVGGDDQHRDRAAITLAITRVAPWTPE